MARLSEHGIRLSSMSPSFLSSNSTSHTWPFSAVAELIDNASDPGVSAKQIWVDVADEAGQLCLTFVDNGSGMTPNKLHKMLSFGFTEKGSGKASQLAIGVYGNGFKSGSMCLGRDALIFTKNGGCQTVGMLSQTYLENIKAQAVIVPIVPFSQQTKCLVVTEDSEASLAAILQNSIVTSQEKIHAHFDSIPSKKGTKILIWNLRRAKDGKPEIDFETDPSDFRLPEIEIEELRKGLRNSGSLRAEQNIPDMHYSLRAYLSVLYLKPRTQIILRGKKNLAKLVSKRLTNIELDVYKPHFSKEKVKVTFGMNPKNKEHYGIMMYHRNRLIKAYEKVGCQLKVSGQRAGVGVIGIIECNFLKPAHNKQDFEYTKEYRLTLGALGLKLNDYWREMTAKRAREREFQALDKEEDEHSQTAEGPVWLQCEECLKWRSVPEGHYTVAPESWNCSQNPNPRYRSCSSPEEAEDSVELLTPSYQKTHKKQEHPKSRKREKSLEVCSSQEPAAPHHSLSRSSSEPSHPSSGTAHTPDRRRTADQRRTKEDTPAGHRADTDQPAGYDTGTDDGHARARAAVTAEGAHTKQRPAETVKEETGVTGRGPGGEERDEKENTSMEPEERRDGTTVFSLKRKLGSLLYSVKKKPLVLEEQPDSEAAEETNPEKESGETETASWRKSSSSSSSRAETPGDAPQRATPRTHSPPPTQTVIVSPPGGSEEPQSRPLPPEGSDREADLCKLAALEKAAQRLRSLLGLEITKTPRGGGEGGGGGGGGRGPPTPSASTTSREVGCQTDVAEGSASSGSPVQAAGQRGEELRGRGCACGLQEQNRVREEKAQSRTRVSDGGACEDSRSPHECLRDIRNNVVVLLTALLPQLDLTGISLETSAIDSILQQIIEVNSLAL